MKTVQIIIASLVAMGLWAASKKVHQNSIEAEAKRNKTEREHMEDLIDASRIQGSVNDEGIPHQDL